MCCWRTMSATAGAIASTERPTTKKNGEESVGHCKGSRFLSSVLFALLMSVSIVEAQERPLSVTYGPKALAQEGDDDHREVIFLSVPEETSDRLYVRVFDPNL